MIKRYVLQYLFPAKDRSLIEAAVKDMPSHLATLEAAYSRLFLARQSPRPSWQATQPG